MKYSTLTWYVRLLSWKCTQLGYKVNDGLILRGNVRDDKVISTALEAGSGDTGYGKDM